MNVLFISPAFPPQFFQFCTALARHGITVLGMGDTPYQELRPELKEALTEYVHVTPMDRYENAYRAVAYLISRYGRIDRLDSHTEHWLPMEGALRDDFNILGPKRAD